MEYDALSFTLAKLLFGGHLGGKIYVVLQSLCFCALQLLRYRFGCTGETRVSAEALLRHYNAAAAAVEAAEGAEATSESSVAACDEAVTKLVQLREQTVTSALLSETGIGLKVKAMTTSSSAVIKAAARTVIAHWKAQVVSQMHLRV